jgi:peroxiredoxin Q/BCP
MLDWWYGELLPPGAAAPDFSLPDDQGKLWTLSALRGRPVLLVFYPGDSTPGCTKQLCEIRDEWATWDAAGVQVLGINPRGQESHARFRRRHAFPFPLLADAGGRVSRQYRCGSLVLRRTVYLIGPDGRIVYARRGMPSSQDIWRESGLRTGQV